MSEPIDKLLIFYHFDGRVVRVVHPVHTIPAVKQGGDITMQT